MLDSETLEDWLDQLGYEYEVAEIPEELSDELQWAVSYKPGDLYQTTVAQQGTDENDVTIQLGIDVTEEHRAAIEELAEDDRVRFLHDLRLALLQRASFFRLDTADDVDFDLPIRCNLGRRLIDEEISRGQFFDAQSELQSSGMIFTTMIRKMAELEEWD